MNLQSMIFSDIVISSATFAFYIAGKISDDKQY